MDSQNDSAESQNRAHQPATIKVRVHEAAIHEAQPPTDSAQRALEPETKAPPAIDRYIPQDRLTRKTELLTPFELDELFPNGVAPSRSITFTLHVSATGTVDEVILPKGAQTADIEGIANTLRRWVFLPGEIHRSAVPSVVEIEFSPTIGLEVKLRP